MAEEKEVEKQAAQATDEAKPTPLPVKKGLLMLIPAIAMVALVTAIAMGLNLCIWAIWLGMVAWASIGGMKVEAKEIGTCWFSALCGIALGILLTQGSTLFGTAGLAVAAVVLLVFIFGMVSHRFTFVCNNYTAAFLTVCTAQGLPLDFIQLVLSLVYGFVVFGLIPLAAVAIAKSKKKGGEKPAQA
jgi:hypothetical protein